MLYGASETPPAGSGSRRPGGRIPPPRLLNRLLGESAGSVHLMPRRAEDLPNDPAVVLANPDDEVTPELFRQWLDNLQQDEPFDPGVRAADTVRQIRDHGEE